MDPRKPRICPHCKENSTTTLKYKGPHLGQYCSNCKKLLKWVSKEEFKEYLDLIEKDPEPQPLF